MSVHDNLNRLLLFLCIALTSVIIYPGKAFSKTETVPFQITVDPVPEEVAPGEKFNIRVVINIIKGYQLYAENTSLSVIDSPGIVFSKVKNPPSVIKKWSDGLEMRVYKKKAAFELPVMVDNSSKPGKRTIVLKMAFQGCSENSCFMPEIKELKVAFSVLSASEPVNLFLDKTPGELKDKLYEAQPDISEDRKNEKQADNRNLFIKAAEKFGIIGVIIAAFIWGILASLTPCVYPMIPVTVSVIGASSSGNSGRGFILSLFYVLGLSLVYAAFGVAAAWSGSLFGSYTDLPVVRIVVAVVFVLLGLSMFDVFFLQVPSSISSKFGGYSRTGVIGVFLTGGVAGMVVGPCVGPMLVGLLVYIAGIGNKLYGFLIMWSFALGLGMLFLIIGTFSGAVASLPKAGTWMEKLKYVFAIIMFAVAIYYIRPILNDTGFILIFNAFLVGLGIFVGTVVIPEITGQSKVKSAIVIASISIGIAWVAGLTVGNDITDRTFIDEKYSIIWLHDEISSIELAMQKKKPVMIDFSADWCKACKDIDRKTFSVDMIKKEAERFVCVKIDCTDSTRPDIKKLTKKYGVVGLPTIIFIDTSGNIIHEKTITKFVNSNELFQTMSTIK